MLILASSSPRRSELLTAAGIPFTIQSLPVDESPLPGEDPAAFTLRLAHAKAAVVFAHNDHATVLGADTIVVCDGEILGKPADAADAARMLAQLSGRAHQVITGVAILSPAGVLTHAETTTVVMRAITPTEIVAYIATGEPMDKAGAYAIQGGAAPFITRIDGDYSNVVGLPVDAVQRLLSQI